MPFSSDPTVPVRPEDLPEDERTFWPRCSADRQCRGSPAVRAGQGQFLCLKHANERAGEVAREALRSATSDHRG